MCFSGVSLKIHLWSSVYHDFVSVTTNPYCLQNLRAFMKHTECSELCKPTAHELSYQVEMKTASGSCHDNGNDNNNNRSQTLIQVKVQGRIQVVAESDKKTLMDVMAEIGGYLGLFVGISMVTMLEFSLFAFSLLFDVCFLRCGNRPKTAPVAKGPQ